MASLTAALAPAPARAAGKKGGGGDKGGGDKGDGDGGDDGKAHKDEDAYQRKIMECDTFDSHSQQFKDCMAEADQL